MKKVYEPSKRLQKVLKIIPTLRETLERQGWEKNNVGGTFCIDYNNFFDLYIKNTKLRDILLESDWSIDKKISNQKNKEISQEVPKSSSLAPFFFGANKPLWEQDLVRGHRYSLQSGFGCNDSLIAEDNDCRLLNFSCFSELPSLMSLQSKSDAIVISFYCGGFSSVYDLPAEIFSWSFTVIINDVVREFVFFRKSLDHILDLEFAIGRILDSLKCKNVDVRSITRFKSLGSENPKTGNPIEKSFKCKKDALNYSQTLYPDRSKVHSCFELPADLKRIPVVLLSHSSLYNLSGFNMSNNLLLILKKCTNIENGLISLNKICLYPKSAADRMLKSGHSHVYPISLLINDTQCHITNKFKDLSDIGRIINVPAVTLNNHELMSLDCVLTNDVKKFMLFNSSNTVIPLLYISTLYGYNKEIPLTITSACANIAKKIIYDSLNCTCNSDYNLLYQGLHLVKKGLEKLSYGKKYVQKSSLEPISDNSNFIQYFCSKAFHGGYNSSFTIGYYDYWTFDYDLRNAYPTAMCLIPDVDWLNPVNTEIKNRDLTLDDFWDNTTNSINPVRMIVAYVTFDFPNTVMFPCIPVKQDGIPIFLLSSKGIDGVYACGPELYLALKLGAKVHVQRGFILNPLINSKTGQISYSLRNVCKQLVTDRNTIIKKTKDSKSLESQILKLMVNCIFGKISQGVVPKKTWNAATNRMIDLPASAITNPVNACMITSIIRSLLLAAQNQCYFHNNTNYSVTTDGFISDIPFDTLKSLDLYGFTYIFQEIRMFLTDNESNELWEIKHKQNDLLNFTTRGNVSLLENGVCAHNGLKSEFPPDSYEDRDWLRHNVLSRTKPISYKFKPKMNLKDFICSKSYRTFTQTNTVNMNFDMKRKPVISSSLEIEVDSHGNSYKLLNFTTTPFNDKDEFTKYRALAQKFQCLRTKNEWSSFMYKLNHPNVSSIISNDLDWLILLSCIVGHRKGLWIIPSLNNLKGQKRYDWINSHNTSQRIFTSNDWKHAGLKERQKNTLELSLIKNKLDELQKDI